MALSDCETNVDGSASVWTGQIAKSEDAVLWTGYKERTRTILRHSQDPGLPCQDPGLPCPHLTEYQSCEYQLCYRWKTTPSSPCRLKYPDMQCGAGMRNRTVECISVLGVSL